MTTGSRVLLAGDASARPEGLERALTRAGFLVSEAPSANGTFEPDAILVTLGSGALELPAAIPVGRPDTPPVVVITTSADPHAPAAALTLGADDALAAPIHLPELCARLLARIRDRQCPRGTAREGAVRRALEALVGEGRTMLRPDEVVLALVRRLARAFDLLSCAFVAVDPGTGEARVVVEAGPGPVDLSGDSPLDPSVHAEITEAIRSRRAVTRAGGGATAVPAVAAGQVLGVLLLRQRDAQSGFSSAQLQFAESLAVAAAKALEPVHCEDHGGNGNGSGNAAAQGLRILSAVAEHALDHRLQEEFERARRYSLSFSLVLLDVGAAEPESTARALDETAERLRRELRVPDFVSTYGGGEFAVVLPETDLDGARRSVARMREQLVARRSGSAADDPPFSAGIVTYPHPAVTQVDDMFALVEAALARGKAQVGERIGVAD